jgi:hypothetical protein
MVIGRSLVAGPPPLAPTNHMLLLPERCQTEQPRVLVWLGDYRQQLGPRRARSEEALHETFIQVDVQVNDAPSCPSGVRGLAGVGSAGSPECMREVLSGANAKLVVGIGEVILDGLRRDEQGLCDLAIRPSLRRQVGNPILGRRERFDAVGNVATRSRASRLQLIATPLEQGKRAAAMGEVHPATQYHAGLADAPMPAKRRTEVDQGTSQFQPGR